MIRDDNRTASVVHASFRDYKTDDVKLVCTVWVGVEGYM